MEARGVTTTIVVLTLCACGARPSTRTATVGVSPSQDAAPPRFRAATLFGQELDPEIVARLGMVWPDPEDALRASIHEQLRVRGVFADEIERVKMHTPIMRRAAAEAIIDTADLEASALDLRAALAEGDELTIVERRFAFESALDDACVDLKLAMTRAALKASGGLLAASTATSEYVMDEIARASAEEIAKPAGVNPSPLIPIANMATRSIHTEMFVHALREVVVSVADTLVREQREVWAKFPRAK